MSERTVYMDNNATTRVDPDVLEELLPYFSEFYGNASNRYHNHGRKAKAAVEAARVNVADLINASETDIIFTSGATEANNLVIKGVAAMRKKMGNHIITQVTEHKAVLDPCKTLRGHGFRVTVLPVDGHGRVAPEQVEEAITDETILVSIMFANNEVGTTQPIKEIGKICKRKGVLFHSDAVQAAGKIPVDVEELGIDLMSMSGHKMYGPKGVGALYVRHDRGQAPLAPLFAGGGQEGGLRPGTQAVPLIVGMGKACEVCAEQMAQECDRLVRLRDRLHHGLAAALPGVRLNGHERQRLPGTLNLRFGDVESEALLMALKDDVAVSPGSACTSDSPAPSHVLKAIRLSDAQARSSVRFSLGRFNTLDEVDRVIELVAEAVLTLRSRSGAPGTNDPIAIAESATVPV